MRHAFHLWFWLIFYEDVYRWQISPPCLGSQQIILEEKKKGIQGAKKKKRDQGMFLTPVVSTYMEAVRRNFAVVD